MMETLSGLCRARSRNANLGSQDLSHLDCIMTVLPMLHRASKSVYREICFHEDSTKALEVP